MTGTDEVIVERLAEALWSRYGEERHAGWEDLSPENAYRWRRDAGDLLSIVERERYAKDAGPHDRDAQEALSPEAVARRERERCAAELRELAGMPSPNDGLGRSLIPAWYRTRLRGLADRWRTEA